jgi:hypothetical protein
MCAGVYGIPALYLLTNPKFKKENLKPNPYRGTGSLPARWTVVQRVGHVQRTAEAMLRDRDF